MCLGKRGWAGVAAVTVVVAVAIPLCPWHGLGEARGLRGQAGPRCLGTA